MTDSQPKSPQYDSTLGNDNALFRNTMKMLGVRPLNNRHNTHLASFNSTCQSIKNHKPLEIKINKTNTKPTINYSDRVDHPTLLTDPVKSQDPLKFFRPGLQIKQQRRLQQGRISIESTLDLHGMTKYEAFTALEDYLKNSLAKGQRCIRIVHGKGENSQPQLASQLNHPPLKNLVNRWLRHQKAVLGFVSCKPYEGGTGAVYVLLKASTHNHPPPITYNNPF